MERKKKTVAAKAGDPVVKQREKKTAQKKRTAEAVKKSGVTRRKITGTGGED